jgi:hypothetical protein
MRQLIERHEHRLIMEDTMAVTPELIAKLRKDFLALVGNVPRVDTVEKLTTFRAGMVRFRDLLERIMNTAKEALDEVARAAEAAFDNALASDARYLAKDLKDPWRFVSDLNMPGNTLEYYRKFHADYGQKPEDIYLYHFTRDAKEWDRKVRRVAPKAWKWFESAATVIAKGAKHGGRASLTVDQKTGMLRELAGFKVRLDGFSGSAFDAEGVQKFERGLTLFRQLARRRLPSMLHNTPPFVLIFSGDARGGDAAGRWSPQEITITFWGMHGEPEKVAHVIAHELAHGIYRNALSETGRDAWDAFIKGDTEPLDLRQVLKDIGDDGWIHEPKAYKGDPIRWLQVQGLGHDRSYRFERGEDIRRWLDGGGEPVVQVTRRPVTGYGHKAPEEAFCDALGMLIAYGPRTVLPEVQQMLGVLLPQLRTEGVEFEALILLLEAKAGGFPCHRTA